jgi:hypothetical protein
MPPSRIAPGAGIGGNRPTPLEMIELEEPLDGLAGLLVDYDEVGLRNAHI